MALDTEFASHGLLGLVARQIPQSPDGTRLPRPSRPKRKRQPPFSPYQRRTLSFFAAPATAPFFLVPRPPTLVLMMWCASRKLWRRQSFPPSLLLLKA